MARKIAPKGNAQKLSQEKAQAPAKDTRTRAEMIDNLSRKLSTFAGNHRKCREPICRRLKRCAGPEYRCGRDFPGPPYTEDEMNRAKADARRLLDAEIARRGMVR